MKEWMEPINSELPLAKAFNRIISDLELLRIMTTRAFSAIQRIRRLHFACRTTT